MRQWLQLFDLLYVLEVSPVGLVQWRRVALPASGGVLDQPAQLLDALEWLARCKNAELVRGWKKRRRTPREARR